MSGPTIITTVSYADAKAAVTWLEETLGLTADRVFEAGGGVVMFAQMSHRNGLIFVALQADRDSPWAAMGLASIALVEADAAAVEASYARATKAGAVVIQELFTSVTPLFPQGCRQFTVKDPEGHLWTVSDYQPVATDYLAEAETIDQT